MLPISAGIAIDDIQLDGYHIHTARLPVANAPTLLLFNGIGANIELFFPLMQHLAESHAAVSTITFDVPGAGSSPAPLIPLRFSGLSALAADLLDYFGYEQVDALGVSWGGALAQEFAFSQPSRCRRLILAATSPGAIMVPGKPSVLLKLSDPRRYLQSDYLKANAAEIYGGLFREDPELVEHYAELIRGPKSKRGYYYQLLASAGWTSIHWLHKLEQPTLIMAGRDDPIVPLVNAHVLHYRIPESRLVELQCGHLFLFTMMNEVSPIISEFLNSSDPV